MRSPKTICKRNEQCQLYTSHLDSEKPIFRNEVCCQHYLFLRESKRQNTYIHIYVYIHIYIYVYIHAYICVCGYICISKIKSSLIRKTNCLPQMLTVRCLLHQIPPTGVLIGWWEHGREWLAFLLDRPQYHMDFEF